MISKQIPVKSVGDTLKYVAGKKEAVFVDSNLAADEVDKMQREFEFVASQNSRKEQHYRHIILSLAPGESLSVDQWQEVGKTWRTGMHDQQMQRHDRNREEGTPPIDPDQIPSYESSPFAMWIHNDRKHQHIHMVCSVIDFDGQVVSDSFERYRSEAVCRQIEREFGLHQVRSSKEKAAAAGTKPKLAAHNIIRQAIDQAVAQSDSPISLQQLVTKLQHEGIQVAPSVTRRTGKVKGIRYRFGEDGEWITGTEIGKEYTFQGLSKHLGISYEPEKDNTFIAELCAQVIKTEETEIEKEVEVTKTVNKPQEGELIEQLPTSNELPASLDSGDLVDSSADPDTTNPSEEPPSLPSEDAPAEIAPLIAPPAEAVDELEELPDLADSISIGADMRPGVDDAQIAPLTVEPPAPPILTPEQKTAQDEYDTTAAEMRAAAPQSVLTDEQVAKRMSALSHMALKPNQSLSTDQALVLSRSPLVQITKQSHGEKAARERWQEVIDFGFHYAQSQIKTPPPVKGGDGR